MTTLNELFGEVIHSYTRADMIADGSLVDVSEIAKEAGFKFPVAMTRAAWMDCVEWTEADTERTGAIQDQEGRLWDVVFMAFYAIKTSNRNTSELDVKLARMPREKAVKEPEDVTLKMLCGPGDNMEPVLTIRCSDESFD